MKNKDNEVNMEQNKPKTTQQRSRKGKKSWRKNIDIDDVEKGLEKQKIDKDFLEMIMMIL